MFALACCRRIRTLIDATPVRRLVELTEEHLEGRVSSQDVAEARRAVRRLTRAISSVDFDEPVPFQPFGGLAVACAAEDGPDWDVSVVLDHAVGAVVDAVRDRAGPSLHDPRSRRFDRQLTRVESAAESAEKRERRGQAALLRDVVGNPFRSGYVDPSWLSWNGGAVTKLARVLHDERSLPAGTLDNARLAVLADALEDAGCTDAVVLDHCRGPGPHVRGCWVVDAVLGKE